MADDPTIPPKPTPRRRRAARSKVAPTDLASPSTVDPGVIEPASSDPGADPVTPDSGTDANRNGAADERPAAVSPDIPPADSPAPDRDATADHADGTLSPPADGRSPDEWVCPFLRSMDDLDQVGLPMELPAVANRCASQPELVPQSLRQQELVCLTLAHVDCPRYTRGARVAIASEVAPVRTRSTSTMTPAMVGALTLLAAAFTASVVFTLVRGGLDLPAAAVQRSPVPSASLVAGVPTAEPTPSPAVDGSEAPSQGETASPLPTPTSTPAGPVSPSPSPDLGTPTPARTPAPSPTSDRYALLSPCPDKPECWIYRVRAGDNLFSIANYFGVPLAKVKALNPWTANGLRAGRDLILPPPTR